MRPDPACDLVIAWTLLDGDARAAFRAATAADDGMWARGRGWALWKSLITLAGPDAAVADVVRAREVVDRLLVRRGHDQP